MLFQNEITLCCMADTRMSNFQLKVDFKAIEAIAEYVDNKMLEKYIREKYL